ncbi:hypothetical protein BpHYR1_010496 [Brachionus plicatilis]|uniref:Uncharacterized protein n=1 Tax=Brachionus plicatilis TaxID=10195 RepID=A0A3M7SIC7_BRAPC|nr:hypothetical protein BpHYR1_010496 [Brachionus plicatilis]
MENTESSEHILENEIEETINDADEIESQPRAKRGKGLVYDHLCNFESFETISEDIKRKNWSQSMDILWTQKYSKWRQILSIRFKQCLKDFHCDHQIATCARLKKCSFDLVAMDLPIESNRKRGAPKKNASCLQRQKNETNASNEPAKGTESDNEDDESEIAPQPSKRIRVDETKKYCRV